MDFFWILVLAAVIGGIVMMARNGRQLERRRQAELDSQLTASKGAAEEDVTKFGEELQRLDSDVAGRPLDEAMRQDYERALDAYDNAKTSLSAVKQPEEIRHVTEILEDGRYAIACVKARVEGRPLPSKLPPCFFNPAHGPSVTNVDWAPAGGSVRSVPACAADAERVRVGADPHIRTVQVGAQRVPYWQGGPAYAPWAQGYYTNWRGSSLIADIAIGSMIFHGMMGLPSLMYGVGDGLAGIGDGIGDEIAGVGEGFGEAIGGVGEGLGDLFGGIGDFFGGN